MWQNLRTEIKIALVAGVLLFMLIGTLTVLRGRHALEETAVAKRVAAPAAENTQPAVTVTFVPQQPFQQVVVLETRTANGPVVEVTATVAGTLVGLPVPPGETVPAGTVVALLRASPLPAQSLIQQDMQRSKAGYTTPPISNGTRWTGSSVPRENNPVAQIALVTPVTGTVLPVLWPTGTLMSAGQPVVRMLTTEPLTASARMNSATAARLQRYAPPGSTVTAQLDNGLTVVGVIEKLGPISSDPAGGYQVTTRLQEMPSLPMDPTRAELQRSGRALSRLVPQVNGRLVIPAETLYAQEVSHSWLIPAGVDPETGQVPAAALSRNLRVQTVAGTGVSVTMVPVSVTLVANSQNGVWVSGLPVRRNVAGVSGTWMVSGWDRVLTAGQAVNAREPRDPLADFASYSTVSMTMPDLSAGMSTDLTPTVDKGVDGAPAPLLQPMGTSVTLPMTDVTSTAVPASRKALLPTPSVALPTSTH